MISESIGASREKTVAVDFFSDCYVSERRKIGVPVCTGRPALPYLRSYSRYTASCSFLLRSRE